MSLHPPRRVVADVLNVVGATIASVSKLWDVPPPGRRRGGTWGIIIIVVVGKELYHCS
jgi:hypothetical protein